MLSLTAKKRILADIKNVQTDDMKRQGIYYEADESDISKGTALVVGPENTPYEGGFYFFTIKFPNDYPFTPPAMTTLTQDGTTRFNPNMYREGKVCLSLLNTWHVGERWSGCQSLSTILLSILTSVLNEKPLQNEPGFESKGDCDMSKIYNRMILHANIHTAFTRMIQTPPDFALPFYDIMAEHFHTKKTRMINLAVEMSDWDEKSEYMDFFRMTMTYRFSTLADKIRETTPRNPIQ